MTRFTIAVVLLIAALASCGTEPPPNEPPPSEPVLSKVLIVDGQSSIYHQDWAERTVLMKGMLEDTGLFTVEVATSPAIGEDNSAFQPAFAGYDVVVVNYEGDYWPEATQKAFEEYVSGGGGFVSVHATNNAFPDWKEWNRMIGVGGWGGRTEEQGGVMRNRDESDGAYLRLRDGAWVRDTETPGPTGSHGNRHQFKIENQNPEHAIMRGMPAAWMHEADDELYDRLRGPAENVTVLAAAYSDPATYKDPARAAGEYEPLLMAIAYGQGRVFHTTLGHNAAALGAQSFITTFQRGAEWAATGEVTQEVPADFPAVEPSPSAE
jgi:type 1 glutamine amidotransferase